MKNLDELLHKAKWDKLSNEELNYVVQKIKSWDSNPSLAPQDHILAFFGLFHLSSR